MGRTSAVFLCIKKVMSVRTFFIGQVFLLFFSTRNINEYFLNLLYKLINIFAYIAKSSKKPFPNKFGKNFAVLKKVDKNTKL